jgi:hypothetical protein
MPGEEYSDARYDAVHPFNVQNDISGTATATASAGIPRADDCAKFELFTRCKLLAMKATVITAASANAVGQKAFLMNGTTQLGDIAIADGAAKATVDGTMTAAACADIAADTELQVDVSGTATVSAAVVTVGPFNLSFTYQELFQ